MQRPATRGVAMTALLSLLAILTFAAPAGVAASGPSRRRAARRPSPVMAARRLGASRLMVVPARRTSVSTSRARACVTPSASRRATPAPTPSSTFPPPRSAAASSPTAGSECMASGRAGRGSSSATCAHTRPRSHGARSPSSKSSSGSTTSSCAAAEASRGSRRTSSVAKASACLRSGSTRRADRNGSIRARTSPGARYG